MDMCVCVCVCEPDSVDEILQQQHKKLLHTLKLHFGHADH